MFLISFVAWEFEKRRDQDETSGEIVYSVLKAYFILHFIWKLKYVVISQMDFFQ